MINRQAQDEMAVSLRGCWLRSFTSITSSVYAHGDEPTCRLPATPSSLDIELIVPRVDDARFLIGTIGLDWFNISRRSPKRCRRNTSLDKNDLELLPKFFRYQTQVMHDSSITGLLMSVRCKDGD